MDTGNSGEAKVSLPSDREIVIVRPFRARKETLFEAWSKPEHLQRWFVCPTLTMPICEMDFREGGRWRRVLHDPVRGVDHATSGDYREIVRPDRLVFTERYEPIPGSDHLVTLTFAERDGVTILTQRMLHGSREARDAHLKSGIEAGLRETHERLDALLASMTATAGTAAGAES